MPKPCTISQQAANSCQPHTCVLVPQHTVCVDVCECVCAEANCEPETRGGQGFFEQSRLNAKANSQITQDMTRCMDCICCYAARHFMSVFNRFSIISAIV